MHIMNIKRIIIGLVVLLSVAGHALASTPVVTDDDDIYPPDLPSGCQIIQAPAGNKLSYHAYALGVQIYRWNGASWDFVAPLANLYADANYRQEVGIHYAGPTWERKNGKVIAARREGCTPDTTAIPWLLLQTVSTEGRGIFSKVTYIQRVNTAGGLVPTTPGSSVGEEKRVPYTAEYYFYRLEH
jgi:Protein of unknown function (DUF3455)